VGQTLNALARQNTQAFGKTFSGVGRPRKAGPRDPNGRLVRPSTAETRAEIISIALRQPHRRGDRDQRRSILIGRLILDGAVRHGTLTNAQLFDAAERYAADYARFKRAVASRRPLAVADGRAMTLDDPEAEAREYATDRG